MLEYDNLDDKLTDVSITIIYDNVLYAIIVTTLLQLTEYNEIRSAADELSSKVKRIQSTLQRITAPNMRAMEK